jgi:hypothetical protein
MAGGRTCSAALPAALRVSLIQIDVVIRIVASNSRDHDELPPSLTSCDPPKAYRFQAVSNWTHGTADARGKRSDASATAGIMVVKTGFLDVSSVLYGL